MANTIVGVVGHSVGATIEPRPDWAPATVPADRPSVARLDDCCLGGFHHVAVDRAAAERVLAVPETRLVMRANRAFLHRAVRFLLTPGIDRFLARGSGIPTVGTVHEIVHREEPAGRVV